MTGWKHRALSYFWNKKDFNRCPKIVVQSKVMSTVLESAAWSWRSVEARLGVAMQQTLPWFGTDDSVHEKRLRDGQRDRMQKIQNFQPGTEKILGADDPRDALQENGGLADQWYEDGSALSTSLKHS